MQLKGDYHTHSQYSHGRGNLRKNIRAALDKGLEEIAITDHGPRTHSLIPLGVRDAKELLEIKEKVERLRAEFPRIKILCGVEANIINHDGDLDVPDDILEELDLVAAGLHLLIIPPDLVTAWRLIIANKLIYRFFPGRREGIRRWNTEMVINAVKRHKIDFITHPGYQLDIDTFALAKACTEEGTYLEINARHGELTRGFVEAASQTEVKFIINSDAHSPETVGELAPGLKIVRDLKLAPERVINFEGWRRDER